MSRHRHSATEWRRIIREQGRSGLSVAAFCRRARVAPASFYVWRRRVREADGFVEVQIAGAVAHDAQPSPNAIELHLPGERWVMIRPGFDRQTLRDLLATLETSAALSDGAEDGA